jgi:hypothetical protein
MWRSRIHSHYEMPSRPLATTPSAIGGESHRPETDKAMKQEDELKVDDIY